MVCPSSQKTYFHVTAPCSLTSSKHVTCDEQMQEVSSSTYDLICNQMMQLDRCESDCTYSSNKPSSSLPRAQVTIRTNDSSLKDLLCLLFVSVNHGFQNRCMSLRNKTVWGMWNISEYHFKITVNNKKNNNNGSGSSNKTTTTKTILPALQISTPGLGNEEDPVWV